MQNKKLSLYFTLSEFTKSPTALRLGADNTPSEEVVSRLTDLCKNVLDPVRIHFGVPVRINSGYRCEELNRAIGGAKTSQHVKGEAADFEVDGVSNHEVATFIQQNIPFDQLILEYYTPGDPHSGWVHVSWNKNYNRHECFRYDKNGRKDGLGNE